ncbi:MAG: hypothetical protein HKL96_10955 [Phycisphaerales bacterium]|nr:hypothetical protein [Phycisphaerales bacterium]
MFDSLKSLAQLGPMMGRLKEVQAKMAELNARLPTMRFQGYAAGGLAAACVTGTLDLIELNYAPTAAGQGSEVLARAALEAVQQAMASARTEIARQMKEIAGDIDLGAMQNMLPNAGRA